MNPERKKIGESRLFTSRRLLAALVAVFLLAAISENVFARGGFRGGGFRFSSGFRSFGGYRTTRGATGSFFRWGRRGPSGVSSFGRTRRPVNTASAIGGSRASMASERSLYTSARQRGTVFSTRQEAAQAFRSRYSSRYTSRFATRPSARPSYIPAATTVDGRKIDVAYNPQRGGYGYIDPRLGRWVFYNALTDVAMMNLLMANHAYWWGVPPGYYSSPGSGLFSWAIILFFLFMGVSVISRFFRGAVRRNRWQ